MARADTLSAHAFMPINAGLSFEGPAFCFIAPFPRSPSYADR
ncbi:hypothetical protein EDF81_3152 [Enterobacter sp. BIGb0383]|nr:hypothetical protein EDF81_3152 [Enterobacter sp. BIGb0383]ROS00936.1 hypothetical protein EC848_4334 [Enterobacter sp. BIGb0359]